MIDRLAARAPDGLTVDAAVWEQIAAWYGEPGRYYHNLEHLLEVCDRFEEVADAVGWRRPHEVFVAILFHDAVYQPGRGDNEARSAQLARERWSGAAVDLERVAQLIELTAAHGKIGPEGVDHEAGLFLDSDMAILGAAPERFARYDADVGREYRPVVPPAAFASGRVGFLEGVLGSPRIFLSDYFHGRLDAAARANLGCALAETHFENAAYWEAHEAWEQVWRASTDDAERHALQGLIQCAAALLQLDRGRREGAARVLARAISHFGAIEPGYRGIDLRRVAAAVGQRVDGTCEDPVTLRDEPS